MDSFAQFKKTDDEKQLVYAEVYAPMIPDSQGDFMTAKSIERIAHDFMQKGHVGRIDTNHDLNANGSIVVESFIARKGDPNFTEGAWVLGVHIPDITIWQKVKSGELNGFSMYGTGRREERLIQMEIPDSGIVKGYTEVGSGTGADHRHEYRVKFDKDGNFLGGETGPPIPLEGMDIFGKHGDKDDPNYKSRYHPGNGVGNERRQTKERKYQAIGEIRERVSGYVAGGQSRPFRRRTARDIRNGVKARYDLDPELAKTLNAAGVSTPAIDEITDVKRFIASAKAAKASTKFGAQVTVGTPESYAKMRLFLTPDGKAGFAINGTNLESLFNHKDSPYRGVGTTLVSLGIQEGGRTLDNFDTFLSKIYKRLGFVESERYKWDEKQKPADWDYANFKSWNKGRPDYLFMKYQPKNVKKHGDKSDPDYESKYHPGNGTSGGATLSDAKGTTLKASRLAAYKINEAKKRERITSPLLQQLAAENGGEMKGFKYRLKTAESLADKIERDAFTKKVSLPDAAGDITDVLRYTVSFDEGTYNDGVEQTLKGLQAKGYSVYKWKNFWGVPGGETPIYQGINAKFRGRDGYIFEVQFHTPQSFRVKQFENHDYFEEYRGNGLSDKRLSWLSKQMQANQAKVPVPESAYRIKKHGDPSREHLPYPHKEGAKGGSSSREITDPWKGWRPGQVGPARIVETVKSRGEYLETKIKGLKAPKTANDLKKLIERLVADTTDTKDKSGKFLRFSPEGRYLKWQGIARDRQYKGAKDFAGLSALGADVFDILKDPKKVKKHGDPNRPYPIKKSAGLAEVLPLKKHGSKDDPNYADKYHPGPSKDKPSGSSIFDMKPEKLDPVLAMYYEPPEDDGFGMPMVRHPYAYSVPFFGDIENPHVGNAILNNQYLQAKKRIEEALENKDWDTYLFYHARPHRADALDNIYSQLSLKDKTELVQDMWIDSENNYQHLERWEGWLKDLKGQGIQLIDDEKAWAKLPDPLTVYRGSTLKKPTGLSWTLNKDTAKWFANRFGRDGVVTRGTVPKSKVYGYLTGRGEEEIIVSPDYLSNKKRIKKHGDPSRTHLPYPHKGGGGSNIFGLEQGHTVIGVKKLSPKQAQQIGLYGTKATKLDVWLNPSERDMRKIGHTNETWEPEIRFMVDRETGDLLAWKASEAIHTQVTERLMNIPAWALKKHGTVDIWSDYRPPASEFYETLRMLDEQGEFDQPDWSDDPKDRVVRPKILGGVKKHGDPSRTHLPYPHKEGGSSGSTNYAGLSRGLNRTKVASGPVGDSGGRTLKAVDLWVNPSRRELRKFNAQWARKNGRNRSDEDWDVSLRWIMDLKNGDIIAWKATEAIHSQVLSTLYEDYQDITNRGAWEYIDGEPTMVVRNKHALIFSETYLSASSFHAGLKAMKENTDPKIWPMNPKILKDDLEKHGDKSDPDYESKYHPGNGGGYRLVSGTSVDLGEKTFEMDEHYKRWAKQNPDEYSIVVIDTPLLEYLWAGDALYISPEGENVIGKRIENFKEFYANNDRIEMGNAHASLRRNLISFGDGRHRTRVLIEMGYPKVPLVMGKEAIENLKALVKQGEFKKHGDKSDPDYESKYHPGPVKLRGFGGGESKTKSAKERQKQFIERFFEETQVHPFDSSQRISRDATAMMEIRPLGNSSIHLVAVQSLYPGERKGGASRMLDLVKDLSEETGMTLSGLPKAYGTHPDHLTTKQLKAWYKRKGFDVKGNSLLYVPKSKATFEKHGDPSRTHLPYPHGNSHGHLPLTGGSVDRLNTANLPLEPPEGHIRMYRGVNPDRLKLRETGEPPVGNPIPDVDGGGIGRWYTTDYEEAAGYANWDYEGYGELGPGRAILAVDVPADKAIEFARAGSRTGIDEADILAGGRVEALVDELYANNSILFEGDTLSAAMDMGLKNKGVGLQKLDDVPQKDIEKHGAYVDDGHTHTIGKGTATDATNGHSHRFSFLESINASEISS